jgi:hypothetical protein
MTKRNIKGIPENPPHVTLTKETIHKLLKQDAAERLIVDPENWRSLRLNAWDMLALERSDFAVYKADAALTLLGQSARISALQARLAELSEREQLAQARKEWETARDAHQKLTEETAAKYGFDWATHAYDRETGEVKKA